MARKHRTNKSGYFNLKHHVVDFNSPYDLAEIRNVLKTHMKNPHSHTVYLEFLTGKRVIRYNLGLSENDIMMAIERNIAKPGKFHTIRLNFETLHWVSERKIRGER